MGFGGGGGGSTTSTVTNKADPWSGIQPYLQQAASDIGSLYNSGQLQYDWFPGSTIAGQSDATKAALQKQIDLGMNGSALTNQAKDFTSGILAGNDLDPNSNPYLKNYVNQALDQVKGKVNSSFAGGGTGAYGSGINTQILSKELGNTAGNIYGQAYDKAKQNQLQAVGLSNQLAGQDFLNLGQLASAGNTQDQYNQSLLNEQINKYNFEQQSPTNALQNFIGLLNQTGGQYGQSQGTTSQPYYGGGGGANALGLLGLGSSLLGNSGGFSGLLGGLSSLFSFSDIRLKHDISHVDTVDGVKVYTFRYLPELDPEQSLHSGVMAQNVIKTHPDAVFTGNDGYLMVDYSKLPVPFRKIH